MTILFIYFELKKIGISFLYNAVLVSAVQQYESATCILIYRPSWDSLQSLTPIPPL